MRLSRTFLALAAGLAGHASAANITVDADRTVTSLAEMTGNNFAIGNGASLVIDLRNALGAPIDGTFAGAFQDGAYDGTGALVPGLDRTGFLIKAGGGTLQYNGFSNLAYLGNRSFDGALLNPLPTDLRPLVAGGLTNAGAQQGFAGIAVIQQGQLQVSGYLNQWADYGPFNAQLGVGGVMLGAAATVIDSGGKISFRNTALNLPGVSANLDDTDHNNPSSPLVARLNYLNNVRASTASRVETGPEDSHILVLHSDMAAVGLAFTESTVGILEGKGRVYKTGASDLRITNTATFTGEFVANGGQLILAAGSGDTLWSAKSVNLASGGQGTNVGFDVGDSGHWKPSYAPGNAGPTTLVVQGSQRVRNFQSLYADGGFTTLLAPGTGGGNFIELAAAGDILTVDHELGYDGYFTGSVVGAADAVTGVRGEALGTLVKTGEGALALFSVGNNMSRLEIRAGRVISNVQSLGSGEVVLSGTGSLNIVQNDAGALRAVIRSAADATQASLVFRPTDSIQYRGATGASLGNADEGLADIVVAQPFFFGQVIVEDGNDIAFSAGNNNAFENASAIILNEGATGRETSIRFNDTNQLVRNLQGAATSRIYLGRGDITLVNASATTYAGGISGVGNLIKSGPNAFTLSGANNYYGATVVTGGSLAATSASGIGNTSGLVVASGAAFSASSPQAIGSLFGRAGASVTVGGALTIGVTDDLRARLVTELSSLPGSVPAASAAYYLATESAGILPGFDFSPATTLGYLVRQYGLVPAGATEAQVAAYLDADGSGSTTLDDLSAADIAANRALLGFSGSLTVGGALTKTGSERLALLGSVTFTGADRRVIVEQGTLQVALPTLGSASSITIGSAGAIELEVASGSTLGLALAGDGTFRKTGAGSLRIDRGAGAPAFDGLYDVVGGDLTVAFRDSAVAGVTREGSVATAAGTSFTAEVATDLAWAGEVFGDGDFTKTGAGTLTLTSTAVSPIFTTGKVRVLAGGLTAAATPEADLEVATGATYTAALLQDDFFDGVLSGGGTLAKQGAFDLRIETAATFTGDVQVEAGSLSLGVAGALATAGSITLEAGTTLNALDGLAQSLNNVSASAATASIVAEVAGTELTLDVAAGSQLEFSAQILGSPVILKTGAGQLSFLRDAGADNVIQRIEIQAGELEASLAGLGGATLDVGALGTLRFFAAAGITDVYPATFAITGTGKIAKSGAGTVDLTAADLTTVSSAFDLTGGTLRVSRAALGARLPAATLSNGATLAFVTDATVTLDASTVTGAGNLELSDGGLGWTTTLALGATGAPGYTGRTSLRDTAFVTVTSSSTVATFGNIDAVAGTTLSFSALTAATVNLTGSADFGGAFIGSAGTATTFAGTGSLDFTVAGSDTAGDLSGYIGTLAIDGAKLILSTANTKSLELRNGGRLELRGPASAAYATALTGDGTGIVSLGAGAALDLVANPATSLDDGAVAKLELLTGSSLTLGLSGTSLDKTLALALSGGSLNLRLTEAGGSLTLASAAAGSTGGTLALSSAIGAATLSVTGDLVGGLDVGADVAATVSGDIGGDVTVDADGSLVLGSAGSPIGMGGDADISGRLSGTGTLAGKLTVQAGGLVAPGYSPGTLVVGDLENAGSLRMEVGADGNDLILFSGSAMLNKAGTGRLDLQVGAGNLFGRRFVILRDQDATGGFVADAPLDTESGRFSQVVAVGPVAARTLVIYPSAIAADPTLASLGVNGEVAAYVVRDSATYATLVPTSPYLAKIQEITEVTLTDLNAGVFFPPGADPVLVAGQWESSLGAGFTSLGARLAVLSDAQLVAALANLQPATNAAAISGAVAGFRSHADTLQRRLEQRRFDGADMSVKTNDWFVDATHGQLDLDDGRESRNTGATAGLINPMGVDGYWAITLGVEDLKSEAGSGSYKGNGFRVGGALGVMNAARTLSLDAGVSYGSIGGDLSRPSLVGGANVTDPKLSTMGAWVRGSAAMVIGGVAVTPFAALEHTKTSLGAMQENGWVPVGGTIDDAGDSLRVDAVDHTQTSARLGFGVHHSWVSQGGDWRYRLGLEVAYAKQLDGKDATLTSNHAQLRDPLVDGGNIDSSYDILPGDGFSVAPTFTFGTSPDSTFTVGLRLEQGSEGEATSLQLGYRRKF